MKFKYIHKYQGGGQAKQIDASFGLPEINIYPQNEFGDIARSQGINRARNWKKVKEGTTKGINDFYNDPRTQMVMAGLPLPSMLDAAGDAIKVIGPVIKNSKVGQLIGNALGKNKQSFKSQINWGRWNREIPQNKQLLDEYNQIEKTTKQNGTWMKNPNGTIFPGTKEQFVQMQSDNFKKAFGNTKVLVDERPMILTHNSKQKFNTFNTENVANGRVFGNGIYTFEEGAMRPELPVFMQKKLRYPAKKDQTVFGKIQYDLYGNSIHPKIHSQDFSKKAVDVIDNATSSRVIDDINGKNMHILFNPNQIKSAIGNNGMFDMTNPNIYASENLFSSKKPANIKEAIDISLKGSKSAKEFVNSDAVKNSAKRNIDLYNRINKTNIIPKDYQAQPGLTSKFVDNFDDYINTNSPTGNTSNIGGLYDKVNNQVVLNKTSVSEPISFHENLHALGYGDRPYNQMKNKYIFDQKKIQGLSETSKNYYIKGNEPAVHYAQLGKTWGVNPGDPYPGRQTVENMIGQNGLSGSPVYTKLDTNRDYRRFWDAISGKYFSIAPIPIIGTQLNNKDKNK